MQAYLLITSSPTDEVWSDDRNWVLAFSSATKQSHGGVGLVMSNFHRCLQSTEAQANTLCDISWQPTAEHYPYQKEGLHLAVCLNSFNKAVI